MSLSTVFVFRRKAKFVVNTPVSLTTFVQGLLLMIHTIGSLYSPVVAWPLLTVAAWGTLGYLSAKRKQEAMAKAVPKEKDERLLWRDQVPKEPGPLEKIRMLRTQLVPLQTILLKLVTLLEKFEAVVIWKDPWVR